MTVALKKIISRLTRLPAREQNAIAGLLEEEVAWQKSFSKSQKQLETLAFEALNEYKKGKTQSLSL
jgi:hypothetical protein